MEAAEVTEAAVESSTSPLRPSAQYRPAPPRPGHDPGAEALARAQPQRRARGACGLDADVEVEIDGHVGYYCAGMNKLATVRVHGTRAPASPRT